MYGLEGNKGAWLYDPNQRKPTSGAKLRRTHSANVTNWEQLYNKPAPKSYRAPLYNRYGSYRQLSFGDLQEEPDENPWIYRDGDNNRPPTQQPPQQPPHRMPRGGRTSVSDGRQTVPLPESRQDRQPSPSFRSSFRGYHAKKAPRAERNKFPADRKEGEPPKKGKGGLNRVRSFLGFTNERSQSLPSDEGKESPRDQTEYSPSPKVIRKISSDIESHSDADVKEKRRSLQVSRNWSPALDTCYEQNPRYEHNLIMKSQSLDRSLDRRLSYNVPQHRRPYLNVSSPNGANTARRQSVGYPGYYSPYPERGIDYPYAPPIDESHWCYLYWSDHDGMKLGSLSKDHKKPLELRKENNNKEQLDPRIDTIDSQGGQLIQRCVIIQQDEKGYGLTVSGDNPVFVQSVKDNGAAARAGVLQGDRIIKVNGTLVTNCNHIEVVKLIKSGSYVALTLLGRPPGHGPTPVPHSPLPSPGGRISGPVAVDSEKNKEFLSQKIATIRMMHEQVATDCEKLKLEFQKSRSESLHNQIEDKNRLLKTLQEELFNLTGVASDAQFVPVFTSSGLPPPGGTGPYMREFAPPGRLGSTTDVLDLHSIAEDMTEHDMYAVSPKQQASWLQDGPKHRKTESMPETLFEMPELRDSPGGTDGQDVTVTRSHSDSHKRNASLECVDIPDITEDGNRHKDELKHRRNKMMKKMMSLPCNVYDTDPSDSSPHISPNSSPVPTPTRDSWMDCSRTDTSEEFMSPGGSVAQESPPALRATQPVPVSSSSSSPPYLPSPTLHVATTNQNQIMSMDDEDFSTDDEHALDDNGPFSELNLLKYKPAHLAIFLHYLISNSDPSPLLFYLVTESYTQGNLKEMRKWAYEIHSTFLVEKAPLRVNVDDGIISNIDHILQYKHDKEEQIRGIFQLARHIAQNEIGELLADFRNKRALGLGNLYGDHELSDGNMDRQAELKIVEKYLWPHLERLVTNDEGAARNKTMASALATFFKQVGCTALSKNNSILDHCPSFVAKDKKIFKFTKSKQKVHYVHGHQFIAQQYYTVTACSQCQGMLWGIGSQGYQCVNCECNIHKQCVDGVTELCSKKKKDKRQSMIGKIIRKQTINNPKGRFHLYLSNLDNRHIVQFHGVKDLHRSQDEGYTSPTTLSPTYHMHASAKEDNDDDLAEEREGKLVTRTVSMPSVRLTASMAKGVSFYMKSQPTLSENEEEVTDNIGATHHRVGSMGERYSEVGKSSDDMKSPTTPLMMSHHSPDTTDTDDQKKSNSALSRSESLNKKRESRKSVRRTRSDVQVDEQTLKALNQSGSSSNSSLSIISNSRSIDSPSNSNEVLNDINSNPEPMLSATMSSTASLQLSRHHHDDSDFEAEIELPPLDKIIPKDVLKKLKPKEKKRQDVLNELIHTEKAHVRNLKVMHKVFLAPMKQESWIQFDLVKLLFPNLEEIIQVHSALNNEFKARKKLNPVIQNIADILLSKFSGEAGEKFRTASAIFCRNQSHALEMLKNRQRKDQKLLQFLQEQSSSPLCRRFDLKDLIPTAMQRLTKYPLLIENLLKYTPSNTDEHRNLQLARQCTKDILNYVNQAVKDSENHQKLVELQRRLDMRPTQNVLAEYKNLDLTRHKMIHDGPLTWRVGKSKQIELHVVLLEDILVLLQKVDDRLVLRCQSTTVVAGKEDTKFTHSPIIKLTKLLTRNVATDKRAFFLVSTSGLGPQIYELVTNTVEERKRWFRYITDAAEAFKSKEVKAGVKAATDPPQTPPTPSVSLPDTAETTTEDEDRPEKEDRPISWDGPLRLDLEPPSELSTTPEVEPSTTSQELKEPELSYSANKSGGSTDSLETVDKVDVFHSHLIQPNEVVVSDTVFVAETVEPAIVPDTTLYEKLRVKNEEVVTAMADKRKLVAEILEIHSEDYQHIAEMSCEITGERESKELLLASMHQMDQLTQLVNTGLKLTNKSDRNEAADSPDASADKTDVILHLPAQPVLDSARNLNELLTHLLSAMVQRDQEHEALKADLHLAQQKLSALASIGHHDVADDQSDSSSRRSSAEMIDGTEACNVCSTDTSVRDCSEVSPPSRPDSFVSVDSSMSESTETADTQRHTSSVDDDSAVFSVTSQSNESVTEPPPPPDLIGPITEQVEDDELRYSLVDDLPLPPPPIEHLGEGAAIEEGAASEEEDEDTETDEEEDEVKDLAPTQHASDATCDVTDVTDATDSTDTDSTGTTVVGAKF